VEHPDKAVLASHALGATPADEEATLEAHLAGCADCRRVLREFRLAAAELVGQDLVDVDLAALDRIWAQVKHRIQR
jgi:hypothetical protein